MKPLAVFHMDFNFVNLRPAYLRHWLEQVAAMGYGAILWEIENKVKLAGLPGCHWPEAMEKVDFQRLVKHARDLGLESIPLLQTIGHGEYILSKPKYAGLREHPDHIDCYCCSNPGSIRLLQRLMAEYLEIFGAIRHFHLGGDEAYVFGTCPDCRKSIRREGPLALYGRYLKKLAEPLIQRGIRPGIWGDMILHHPGHIGAIPRDFTIWDWNYHVNFDQKTEARVWGMGTVRDPKTLRQVAREIPELLDRHHAPRPFYTADFLKHRGYDVFLCSASRAAGDSVFLPDYGSRFKNIIDSAVKSSKDRLAGTCVTSWAIRLNSFETQAPLLALAPLALRRPDLSREEIGRNAMDRCFGTASTGMGRMVEWPVRHFPFSQERYTGIQWRRWKDDGGPGPNHVRDLIREMKRKKNHDGLSAWDEMGKRLEHALPLLHRARETCGEGARWARRNAPWLLDTGHASNLMYQHGQCIRLLLQRRYRELHGALLDQKAAFLSYRGKSETPLSAEKNANLVYGPLLDHSAAAFTAPGPRRSANWAR